MRLGQTSFIVFASKLAAERYACAYHEVYDLPTVALQFFTVYGPRMRPNMAISNFVSRCINGDSTVGYGDGTQTRDFTYIDGILEANRTLLSTDAEDGEAVNIGLTDNIQIRTLAEEIRDHLASDLELELAERYDADHTHADTAKGPGTARLRSSAHDPRRGCEAHRVVPREPRVV